MKFSDFFPPLDFRDETGQLDPELRGLLRLALERDTDEWLYVRMDEAAGTFHIRYDVIAERLLEAVEAASVTPLAGSTRTSPTADHPHPTAT
jgi:hypothetical protein